MIRLENITYRYSGDSPPALLNVNLEFAPGESVCVMGANGSGKSTFARLVAGLLKTQQGRMSVNVGKNVPIPVGLLFQNPDNQMVAVTVQKEIAFALENLGVSQPDMEKRINRILLDFSIEHLRRRMTSELSVGEKQKVALAALFVFNPPVLVLDEPDSFLDKAGRELFRRQLEKIKDKTPELIIIEITQYPQVARQYERLIVFHNGRVAADRSPAEILQNKSFCLNCGIEFDFTPAKEIEMPQLSELSNGNNSNRLEKIIFERVSYSYPGSGQNAVSNFSGVINRNEITAIVGPSASGKSTLSMLMCGINEPDSGQIRWVGQNSREMNGKAIRGQITAALQQPERQFFLSTCEQEVEFGPRNFGRTISRRAIQGLFKMSGLSFEQFYKRDPFTLSLGEKRRLAFASVLSIFPGFIVFDEPTCSLDREGVGRFILMAQGLKKAGAGVVFISHDDEIIKALADKIILLDGKGNFWSMTGEAYFQETSSSQSPVLK
ncbi:MAG: ABC transporter ATP-binding protein [Candidatus Zixiibacteriota bacterium]